jgi:hypothetical protein
VSLFSKLRVWTGKAPEPAPDPLAEIDAVIAQLEQARDDARKILIHNQTGDRSALQAAVKRAEAKLEEWREKRAALAVRWARTRRVKELTAELRALNHEARLLSEAGGNDERVAELRKRAAEIDIEAAELKRGGGGG